MSISDKVTDPGADGRAADTIALLMSPFEVGKESCHFSHLRFFLSCRATSKRPIDFTISPLTDAERCRGNPGPGFFGIGIGCLRSR
jgi:hypothetical protein